MAELDFINFGIKPNNRRLLRRIDEALSELYTFCDLELYSAWLYHGSLTAASKAFNVSLYVYRKSLTQRQRYLHWKLRRFTQMSEGELDVIIDGSLMIMGMSHAERKALLPTNCRPPITKAKYVAKVESWRESQKGEWRAGHGIKNLPISLAVELLEAYVKGWKFRSHVRHFFESSRIKRLLENAFECRSEIEADARTSEICSVALDIFREYENYREQWTRTRAHMNEQRRMSKPKHRDFLLAVGMRDGVFCRECDSVENLQLDHKIPVSRGGYSVLENFQLLCFSCNSKKGAKYE